MGTGFVLHLQMVKKGLLIFLNLSLPITKKRLQSIKLPYTLKNLRSNTVISCGEKIGIWFFLFRNCIAAESVRSGINHYCFRRDWRPNVEGWRLKVESWISIIDWYDYSIGKTSGVFKNFGSLFYEDSLNGGLPTGRQVLMTHLPNWVIQAGIRTDVHGWNPVISVNLLNPLPWFVAHQPFVQLMVLVREARTKAGYHQCSISTHFSLENFGL